MDPREAVIGKRLAGVRRLLAVTGGKGGTGKTTVAALLALGLADAGARTGLLDLDLTAPSAHLVLGFPLDFPAESFGLDPVEHGGVRCLSLAQFALGAPAALRGEDVASALVELLAVARWGELGVLVLDLPPGLGDATLELLRLLPRAESLAVATPSRPVLSTVGQMLRFLSARGAPVAGVVENLARDGGAAGAALAREHRVPFLAALPQDPGLETALGDPRALRATAAARALAPCVQALLGTR